MSAIVETVQRWNFVDTVVKSNDETKDNSNVTIGFVFDDSVNDDAAYAQKLAGKMSGQAISVASVKDGNKFDVLYVPYKENIDLLNIFQLLNHGGDIYIGITNSKETEELSFGLLMAGFVDTDSVNTSFVKAKKPSWDTNATASLNIAKNESGLSNVEF